MITCTQGTAGPTGAADTNRASVPASAIGREEKVQPPARPRGTLPPAPKAAGPDENTAAIHLTAAVDGVTQSEPDRGRAGRIILHDAAAKASHTKTRRRELSRTGIVLDRIRSCLDGNFAVDC